MAGRPFLRCLGQPALFSPSGDLVGFRTKKHLALLVYLAVEPAKAHRRDRLAELLWPNVATTEARHSLATALSVLRPRLGPGTLETTRENVLLPKGYLELDIDRLTSGDVLGSEAREPIHVAGFLDGFDIPDSAEFAIWKDRRRASLLPAIKSALAQLIDQCRRTSDLRQIEQYAEAMLGIDELSEEAIRAKMEARAFAGDRLTALRVFEDWKGKLKEAVDAQPSALVEGMALRLRRRGWDRSDTADIPVVPTDQWRGRLFVGRYEEYRVLYEAWEQTKRGRARHALVLGDSGVGKTTLVNRLVTAAGLEGGTVSRAQCYDLEREIPYAALGNLTLGLLDVPGVSATPPEVLGELARYFKGVRRRFPAIPAAEESQGETARLRLTEAFHQTLETIAEDHPVILVVDDFHLCDEASLSVLHLLMQRAGNQPLMFVLVARAGELPHSQAAARLRADAGVLQVCEILIPTLSEAESHEVLLGLIGPQSLDIDPALRRAMVRVAGGYPMVIELLVQDWKANGSRSLALALDSMTEDFGSVGAVPELYRKVLDRAVFALDVSTRNVLNVAAVLGHRLNDLSLYEIADLGPGQVMGAMADLVRHRILRDNGRGLEFINEFVRTAAYLEVPSPVRRTLHACIAERLLAEESKGVQFLGLEIAWHAIRAGQAAGVPTFLLKGAQQAVAKGALDEAARALGTALPHLDAEDRDLAALSLAEVLQEQGRWFESTTALHECRADSSGLKDVYSILARHRTELITAERLTEDVHLLHSIIASDAPVIARLRAVNASAQLMGDMRDPSVARALYQAAATLSTDGLVEDDLTQLELCLAQLLYFSGEQENAYEALRSLELRLKRSGIVNSRLARVYIGIGAVRCYQGNYEEAREAFRGAYELAVRIGNESQQAAIAANVDLCCYRMGEYKELLEWNRNASRQTSFTGFQRVQPAFYRACALAMLDRPADAIQAFDSPENSISPDSPLWLIQARKLLRADILQLCGHRAAALLQARDGLSLPEPVLHSPSFAGSFARWLALACMESDRTTAIAILDGLTAKLPQLDALDRVEVMCARLLMGGAGSLEIDAELRKHLAALPLAVTRQLQRLGALQG